MFLKRKVSDIKIIRRAALLVLFLCYLTATIVQSDLWGNLLSPTVTFLLFLIVVKAFVIKANNTVNRIIGIALSVSLLAWAIADIMWAVSDMLLQVDPEEIGIITSFYSITNLGITVTLTVYGLLVLRRWNIVQTLLDSVVLSYLIITLLWIIFLKEDLTMVVALLDDPNSLICIITDVLIINWIIMWYVAARSGYFPIHIRFITAGAIIYAVADLIYYYQYLYGNYNANTVLDASYILSFGLFAVAGLIKLDKNKMEDGMPILNIGRKGKGYFLLMAPIMLITYHGFKVEHILVFMSVILFYIMASSYIQNNIYREALLKEEKELTFALENKVKQRTEELEENNKVLQHLIDQDYITGLYNRRYLLAFLEEASGSLADDETIALLYLDINRYKMITTMFGHYIGEKILYDMAEKLKPMEKLAKRCILSSYGDDAYIFAAVGKYDYIQANEFAEEAIRLSSDIYHIEGYQIRITANIGISLYPYDALTIGELIKHADIAMTQARMKGFNIIREFDLKMSDIFVRRNNIELMLKKADFRKEFIVYYQPQLETVSRKIIGFEALLRWKTVSGEFISPAEFISVAEETGSIIPIGDWVMRAVMKQLVEWNSRFHDKIMIGINVSLKQLNSDQFKGNLKAEMDLLQIDPKWVDLEITESLQLMENPEVINTLEEIRELGVTISIDDFGTGYSSLSYFKGLPADRIKLAKELIDTIHMDDFDYQLVKAIIHLSHAKGIKVIAEGVETQEQWETLKELQCDEVQGFFFGRPVSSVDIEKTYY